MPYIPPDVGNVNTVGDLSFAPQTAAAGVNTSTPPDTPIAPNANFNISHSATQNITQFNSVSCNNGSPNYYHSDNSYIRRFTLSDFGINDEFTVSMVQIGIESAVGASGTQSASVNLYTWNPATSFTFANFSLIGTANVQISDQSITILNVPVVGTIPAGGTLVVEFFTPDGQTAGNRIFVGSNADGQTDATFLAAADCGITNPTDTASIGFPDMHLVMNVLGSTPAVCSAPSDIPWLAASPGSGTTISQTASLVDLTFDSTGLGTGVYSGTLCINNNDSTSSLVTVPVTMTVCTEPTAVTDLAITQNGSHVDLSWTGTGATEYQIYRGDNDPYFTPAAGNLIGTSGSSPFTDNWATGSTSNNYTYVVLAADPCGSGSVTAANSNRTAEFDFAIVPGS